MARKHYKGQRLSITHCHECSFMAFLPPCDVMFAQHREGPVLAPTSTTQDAPGAGETYCHRAEMDLISSQPLSEALFLFQNGFSVSNPPLKVTINPMPE